MTKERGHERAHPSDGPFVYETSHRIKYDTKEPVPISEIIVALQGLQGLLRTVPGVVEGLTGIEILDSEFTLQSLESGSLLEDVAVKFFFKDRAALDAFVEKAGGNGKVKGFVVGAALASVIGYGLSLAVAGKQAPSLTVSNNVIISMGAGGMELTPEAFSAIVSAALQGSKKEAAQNAIRFVAPARAEEAGKIEMGAGGNTFEVPSAAVAEVPRKLDLGKNERVEELAKVVILIRANDLDSKKSGWAGKIDGRTERLKIELDPTINESELFGKTRVTADAVLVHEPRGRAAKLTPAKIFIRKIY